MKKYAYTVVGTAGNRKTWRMSGTLESEFANLTDQILREAFAGLTEGKAVFDHSGVGCRIPLDIIKLIVWQRKEDSLPFVESPSIVPE